MGPMGSFISAGANAVKSHLGGHNTSDTGGFNMLGMAGIASSLLQQTGGISRVLAKLQDAGLGDIAASWMGSDANLPLSGDQLQQTLGGDTLNNLAQGTGTDGQGLASQLATMLPNLIDQFTPAGAVDGMPDLGAITGLLPKFYKDLKTLPTCNGLLYAGSAR
jgi:uncharacterized protein YidB (DUF937 family)